MPCVAIRCHPPPAPLRFPRLLATSSTPTLPPYPLPLTCHFPTPPAEVVREVSLIVYDEIHYLRDKERGVVWEESIILAPR